jgi:hypothetical protein
MGVPAGQQLDGAAGREAGTDERVESGLTTFLTALHRSRDKTILIEVRSSEDPGSHLELVIYTSL